MTFIHSVTATLSMTKEQKGWEALKEKLQARFGTLGKAAAFFDGCHTNSFKLAAYGLAPNLAEKLKKEGLL